MSTDNKTNHTPAMQPIAIVGMSCFFPKSPGLKEYWRLVYQGDDAITDIPDTHWSPEDYFDDDPKKPDHVYCRRGGFLDPIDFDPSEFGIPPATLEATDTSQLLGLMAAQKALEDAGYTNGHEFNRERTSVILGVTGTQELVIPLGARLGHPIWRKALNESGISSEKSDEIVSRISDAYVPWQENSFPGLLGNVVAGRIANRLNLGGTNCVVDAACASSMSAIHLAVMELITGRSDMVLTGGVDAINDIFMHMCFSKTMVLSPTSDVRPFSKDADGTVLGEGAGIIVLKRLADAERDNDRIYAVIKGIGSSSDGKAQSIYAPRADGQAKALKAAYGQAQIDPGSVGLVEAHGTGTRVGDKVEVQALSRIFSESHRNGNRCAIGSVKSNIGHTKAAAGAAGLVKTAMALYHKVLPQTIKADKPDPGLELDTSPFYLSTQTRPWLTAKDRPRRAGVSAFGFGGSNFHVVLEEYQPAKAETAWIGSADIVALSAEQPGELINRINRIKALQQDLSQNKGSDYIRTLAAESRKKFRVEDSHRLLFAINRETDFSGDLETALNFLSSGKSHDSWFSQNIFYGRAEKPGRLAFVFPGQGSQYTGMGLDLICTFPDAFAVLEQINSIYDGSHQLGEIVYPRPAHSPAQKEDQEKTLRNTRIAQPAIGAVSLAMLKIIQKFNLSPDATCGHSFGELTALCAAGWISETSLLELAVDRGKCMASAGGNNGHRNGAMLAVGAPLAELEDLVRESQLDVILANRNSPNQGVLSGSTGAIAKAADICRRKGFKSMTLPVSAAFHSRWVAQAQKPFAKTIQAHGFTPAAVSVFANTTGTPYPDHADKARDLLANHLVQPVAFADSIENMYAAGVRTFVEVGPKSVLTGLVKSILAGRPHQSIALDASSGKRCGVSDLARALCQLAALGYPVTLTAWENISTDTQEKRMRIPIAGANYRPSPPKNEKRGPEIKPVHSNKTDSQSPSNTQVKTNNIRQSAVINAKTTPSAEQKTPNSNIMANQNDKQSPYLTDALRVVQEGLQSIQKLQAQTAQAHQKFLEAQTEANRTLQAMMANTQRLAEASLGLKVEQAPVITETHAAPDTVPPAIDQTPNRHTPEPAQSLEVEPSDQIHPAEESEPSIPEAAAPASSGTNTEIESTLVAVVSELTGYPPEMLGLDMDIESDLGIDSIKRVEILSTLEEKMPDLPAVSPEVMGSLRTLGQIAAYLTDGSGDSISQEKATAEPTPEYPAASGGSQKSLIQTTLVAVVSELTGYPDEMLGLDMDIEADLGIDSIKRVEILSSLEEKLPHLPSVSPEIMGSLRTLGQIIDYLSSETNEDDFQKENIPAPPDASSAAADENADRTPAKSVQTAKTSTAKVKRQIIAIEDAPTLDARRISIDPDRKIIVTDDKSGLSRAVFNALSDQGINTVHVSLDILNYRQDLPKAAGLIIVQDPDVDDMVSGLKDAFHLTRHLAADIIESAQSNGGLLATVSRLDGAFGFKGNGQFKPEQGGLAALAKTVAVEWENVCCHAIDVEPEWQENREIAKAIVDEVLTPGPVEIGLSPHSRLTLNMNAAPYPQGDIQLSANDVVVVSGGARGITAASALALAENVKPTLVLIGRSPKPSPEPDWLASIEDAHAIKQAIIANEFADTPVSPAQVERVYKSYAANREVSRNLEAIKAAGAEVFYYSADIRSADQIKTILEEVRTEHGPIRAVIHGAGVLEDRRIVDKTPEQFERVFDTKVVGFKNLLQATRDDELNYLILYSSISARVGNQGQVDYAMANEVLNKMAQRESSLKPDCRVISINWGPWDGGMVTATLKREFERNGVGLIPTGAGAQSLLKEMRGKTNSSVEVIIGSDFATAAEDEDIVDSKITPLPAPPQKNNHQLSLAFEREVDLESYPVLKSHVIDGKPVVPMALMAEWFGHGALHANPGLVLQGLDGIRILKGIRLDQEKKFVRLMAGKIKKNGTAYEVDLELRDGIHAGKEVIHSKAKAILSDNRNDAPEFSLSESLTSKPYTRSIDDIYDKILFHGSHLHGIRSILSCTAEGVVATVSPAPMPAEWLKAPFRNQWLCDPLALDSAFQLATLWCYEEHGMVSLPSYGASYRQYHQDFPEDLIKVVLHITHVSDRKMQGDFTFLDSEDRVVAQLKGYEAIMYESLFKAFKPKLAARA